jgi:ribbon-helix-helix CopG family protein
MMKPRIGVYLSKQMAARLAAAAAKHRGASKSALVEAALAQFLGDDDDFDYMPVGCRLSLMSSQLERLDQNLKVVNEIVALQARYQLAVTPPLSPAALREACALGAKRFDEFATQVEHRVQSGASLMQETVDRLAKKPDNVTDGYRKGMKQISSSTPKSDLPTSCLAATEAEHSAAVREGGSPLNFRGKAGIPLH